MIKSNTPIAFVTTNTGKLEEVQGFLSQLDQSIILEQVAIELPEIQSLDIHKVALEKAKEAWSALQKPLLIDDGGIYLERYHQFPGPLVKYVYQGIGLEGFWLLAKDDPRGYFLSCLVYYYGPDKYQFFEGVCHGTFIKPPAIITRKELPFTEMFIPQGSTKTLAQLHRTPEGYECHHRCKSLEKFVAWIHNHQ